jgi:hypothetical protein
MVSVARIRLGSWESVRAFKGIICDDVSEFESYHPSHAVRSLWGHYVAVICDEAAFWYQDSSYANPDVEILNAVRPGLMTTRGMLVLASSG